MSDNFSKPYRRKSVSEHNGRIWAESQFGKGATFYIQIPIIQPEEIIKEDVEGKEGL